MVFDFTGIKRPSPKGLVTAVASLLVSFRIAYCRGWCTAASTTNGHVSSRSWPENRTESLHTESNQFRMSALTHR